MAPHFRLYPLPSSGSVCLACKVVGISGEQQLWVGAQPLLWGGRCPLTWGSPLNRKGLCTGPRSPGSLHPFSLTAFSRQQRSPRPVGSEGTRENPSVGHGTEAGTTGVCPPPPLPGTRWGALGEEKKNVMIVPQLAVAFHFLPLGHQQAASPPRCPRCWGVGGSCMATSAGLTQKGPPLPSEWSRLLQFYLALWVCGLSWIQGHF